MSIDLPNGSEPNNSRVVNPSSRIHVATLNVLHNEQGRLRNYFLRAEERYNHTIDLIQEMNADVFAFQEVTSSFLGLLMGNSFIRENFYLSDILSSQEPFLGMPPPNLPTRNELKGNIILSKYPMKALYRIDCSYRYAVAAKILPFSNQDPLLICCFHPKALDICYKIRRKEMKLLNQALSQDPQLQSIPNVIVLGDFNIHKEFEEKDLFEPNNLIDIWPKDRPEEDSYTFDAKKNLFIPYYIPFERRQMRLDRITIQKGTQLDVEDIHLWANSPIREDDYLFSSDHFGLYATFRKVDKLSF